MRRVGLAALFVAGELMLAACGSAGRGKGGDPVAGDQVNGQDGTDFTVDPNQPGPGDPTPDNPYGAPEKVECDQDGATQTCFDGDEALIGKGECTSGVRTCTEGFWTPCIGQVIPVPEYCDYRDNNCDGQVDEGVRSACDDCNPYCNESTSGAGTEDPLAPEEENSQNVVTTNEGWITLTEELVNLNVIWVANSQEGTVSKLDTTTGYEMGRYVVCNDPSRTAVGKYGDGWIACRSNSARVAYIFNFEGDCVDKNQDGTIQTSRDENDNHIIEPNERLPEGQDECVRWMSPAAGTAGNPGGANIARALGVDLQENAWVGVWEQSLLVQMEKEAGSIIDSISIPAQPYGLAIDKNTGLIWVSGRGGGWLVRVDPQTKAVNQYRPNSSYSPYGITIDEFSRPWTAQLGSGQNAVYMFDPNTEAWKSVGVAARARGLVSNFDGRIFVANDQSHRVSVIDETTVTMINEVSLGGGHFPLGMAVDSAGFIWAVNQQSGTVHKINGNSLAVVGNYPVGTGPYTYSDMTGSAFFDAVPPGWYRHRFEASQLGGVTGLAAMT